MHAFFWLYKSLKSCNIACSYPSYSHWWWHLRLLYCTIFSQYVHCSKCIKTYKITPSHALLQSKLFLEIPTLLFWKDWTCFNALSKLRSRQVLTFPCSEVPIRGSVPPSWKNPLSPLLTCINIISLRTHWWSDIW